MLYCLDIFELEFVANALNIYAEGDAVAVDVELCGGIILKLARECGADISAIQNLLFGVNSLAALGNRVDSAYWAEERQQAWQLKNGVLVSVGSAK